MDQQIVYLTGDGEYEIRHIDEEHEETELTQEENDERELQQLEVHVEQPVESTEAKEQEDDLRLECEGENYLNYCYISVSGMIGCLYFRKRLLRFESSSHAMR